MLYLVLDGGLLVLVQMHLDETGSIEAYANSLAHNLCGEYQVLQDAVVHRGERAGVGALLLVALARLPRRLGEDLAVANKHHVLPGEFLFQLTHQADLHLLEGLQLGHRHIDDD